MRKSSTWMKTWRINAEKKTLLEQQMKKEGWRNFSAYLEYMLFGDTEKKIELLIENKDPESITLLLRNTMLELADYYLYIKQRYDKDMRTLYQEEHVDIKQWIAKTNKWHSALVKKTEETFRLCRRIAKSLGLDEYFRMPTDESGIDPFNSDKETMDKMAEQLRRERIALGLGDIVEN